MRELAGRPGVDLIIAIHGILTGRSEPTWPEQFEAYISQQRERTAVITDQYDAGPTPRLNWFLENPRRGKAIARLVADWMSHTKVNSICFVAHSNGTDIARRAIIELDRTHGIRVDTAVLVSPPLPPSTEEMDLADSIRSGALGRLIVYAAGKDAVLGKPFSWKAPWRIFGAIARWPYGTAGTTGLTGGQRLDGFRGTPAYRTVTRMFPDWGHCDFFPTNNQRQMVQVFDRITSDLYRHP